MSMLKKKWKKISSVFFVRDFSWLSHPIPYTKQRLVRANEKAAAGEKLSESELAGQMTCVKTFGDRKLALIHILILVYITVFRVLIFGAQDTTSSVLSRILHLVATHSDIQEKVSGFSIPVVNFEDYLSLSVCRFAKKLQLHLRM